MKLFACSVNYTNTPLELRERMAVSAQHYGDLCRQLHQQEGVQELYLLSTCNRTEMYALCRDQAAFDQLLAHFARLQGVAEQELQGAAKLAGDQVVAHLLRVACGIHSMVLGEPQILGQIKSAYALARHQGVLGRELDQLMQFCFYKVKKIRTVMPLGREPVSIASAMVKIVAQIFDSFSDKRLILVGAGETIECAARYLADMGVAQISIVNRTLENAVQLARHRGLKAASLHELPELLPNADLVVTATASQLPIIGKGMIEKAMAALHGNSLVLFDLAVPRDIEIEAGELDGVYIYSIDDLGRIIEQNKQLRQQAADATQQLILDAQREYHQQRSIAMLGREFISPLRDRATTIRNQELDAAMTMLARGDMPEFVVFQLAHNLTKKLLHQPFTMAKDPEVMDSLIGADTRTRH